MQTTAVEASPETDMEAGLSLIKQGCAALVATGESNRVLSAITLLKEASTVIKSIPDAGESGGLRWRLYQTVQAQEGSDNAAFFKELRCSIHLGLAGEISEPVTLPCGHSFCKTCLATFFTMPMHQRKCPQCREQITVTYQNLRTNVAIKGVVDHLLPMGHVYDEATIQAAEARIAAYATANATASAAAANTGYHGWPSQYYAGSYYH